MEVICTTCCKDKSEAEGLLPAVQRYLSERIDFVSKEAKKLGKPLIILSGKYGFIAADHEIPWYDQALEAGRVAGMLPMLVEQLEGMQVSRIVFYAQPRTAPGLEPYYHALERACSPLGISITYKEVDLD
jgi:hypothetical protein